MTASPATAGSWWCRRLAGRGRSIRCRRAHCSGSGPRSRVGEERWYGLDRPGHGARCLVGAAAGFARRHSLWTRLPHLCSRPSSTRSGPGGHRPLSPSPLLRAAETTPRARRRPAASRPSRRKQCEERAPASPPTQLPASGLSEVGRCAEVACWRVGSPGPPAEVEINVRSFHGSLEKRDLKQRD